VKTFAFTDRRRVPRAIALGLLLTPPISLIGCIHPTEPPAPPSGGHTLVLDYDEFAASVEPILTQKGCDAGGDCHGGGIRGTLELSPTTAKDTRFDFDQVVLQVNATTPDSSHILTKPLAIAAGGVPHAVKVFATVDDPGYQAIRTWILHGDLR
jgi:hypothetical protein